MRSAAEAAIWCGTHGEKKSVDWLSLLTALVAPPAKPLDHGSLAKRRKVEEAIQLKLPDDLFEITYVYGLGEFRTNDYSLVLSIENPFSPTFVRSLKKSAKQLNGLWDGYEVHPKAPGLFPGGTGNGPRDLYYYTEGALSRWPLVSNVSLLDLFA